MGNLLSAYRGCLLGLAVGDAMGLTVDKKTYEEICRDYGPNGLLGYDLVNGRAEVSSHTQIAAFTCNALLLGETRGRSVPLSRCISLAMREWAVSQRYQRFPDKPRCWVSHIPQLRGRHCMDPRMLDNLARNVLGTPEAPAGQLCTAGSLPAAVAVGLFFTPERMPVAALGKLGAEAVALTHGSPLAFLSGATLAYLIAGIVQDPQLSLEMHTIHAADAVCAQFSRDRGQVEQIRSLLHTAIALTKREDLSPVEAMTMLGCDTAPQVLAGAVYAALSCGGDFDTAMISAVNHSGRSAATGALTGAILGAALGDKALPEFYLECLEPIEALNELAADLAQSFSKNLMRRLFNDDWDRKYIQGEPVEPTGWAEV